MGTPILSALRLSLWEEAFSISADQSFYYLIADTGNVQLGDETQPELREQMMALIAKGQFTGERIEQTTLQTYDQPSAGVQGRLEHWADARFLVTNRELKWKGQVIGTLYVGKEVTLPASAFSLIARPDARHGVDLLCACAVVQPSDVA